MNISGKYLKVWKVKQQNGYTKLDLGDSKKNKDGDYDNWTWFDCLLVGNAKNANVNENDTIEITNGIISQEKYKDKWYTKIVIFDLVVMKREQQQPQQEQTTSLDGFQAMDSGDDIPF
jgi:hypothetical protein